MAATAEPRKRMQVVPPADATHFTIWRLTTAGSGGGRRQRMTGPPAPNGEVPDAWPVAEFSTSAVLKAFGEGKYRVEWYGADGEKIAGAGQQFEVATPAAPGKHPGRKMATPARRMGGLDSELEPEAERAQGGAAGAGIGMLELMAMLRAERDDAREQAAAQAERDRQFWAQQQQSQMQMLTMLMGSKGGGAGAGGPEQLELLRRELKLAQQEGLFQLRKDLGVLKAELEPDDDPDDDPNETPPADMGEAGERIGMRMMSELEHAAPELVQQMLPSILSFLQGKGFKMSDELRARIAAAQNGHANGG